MEKEELLKLNNVLINPDGFKVLEIILTKLCAFDFSINRDAEYKEIFLQLGKKEVGFWLLDCIFHANKEMYLKLIERN